MKDRLTEEQSAAVYDRGHSLLVSAAAGSGKTKVLVERLFSYVEQEGANLDDFLIITYTRAAAAELRGKIAQALSEKLREKPSDLHLQHQMMHLYRTDIKTVDAFCTSLLRENCHLLPEDDNGRSLRPDFRVLDESEAQTIKMRVLSRIMDQFYEDLAEGDGGALLADTLGAGRDDRSLQSLVLELHTKLQAQPYVEKWLKEQIWQWTHLPAEIEQTPYAALLFEEVERKAEHWERVLRQAAQEMSGTKALEEKYLPAFLDVAEQLTLLERAARVSWDAVANQNIEFPRLAAVKAAEGGELKEKMKRLWDGCKKSVKGIREIFCTDAKEAMQDLQAAAPAMVALLQLTERFSKAYQREKRRSNAADFSDQEHEAICLLVDEEGQPTELADFVAQRYREVMVDEYQDTNEVQNQIFFSISHGGKSLFTVGDVKQSIYRFRLANPYIFLKHYEKYPHASKAEKGESAKLLLTKNFRSRQEILESTNFIFSNILSREMGELDYGEEEALHLGASYAEADGRNQTEFHLLDASSQEGEKLRSAQVEANFAARYIKDLLTSKFTVQDEKNREFRPICEDDIVILMRSPRTRLKEYRQALAAQGLSCSIESDQAFYETIEIAVVFSFLQIIDNPRQDVPLISVLRSPLFGFTPDRLGQLRAKKKEGDFFDALLADEQEDTKYFLKTLQELRLLAQTMSAYELLGALYERCHVLAIFGAMPNGEAKKENLLAFFKLAAKLDGAGFRGVFSFVRHLQELIEAEQPLVPQTNQSTQGIRIMSIHKSKGLEFPVVILADLARNFSGMDFVSSVLVHPELGLGPLCVDTDRMIKYPSVARQAIEKTIRRESKAEEMRVLYVGMTRAKEKLVMLYTRGNLQKHLEELESMASCPVQSETVEEQKCLGDWILLPLLCRPEAEELRREIGMESWTAYRSEEVPWKVVLHRELSFCGVQGNALPEEMEQRQEMPVDAQLLSYQYPYGEETSLPAKLTATQLKGRVIDEEIAENAALPPRLRGLRTPKFLAGERHLDAAERGTAVHAALQYLAFDTRPQEEAVRIEIDTMRAKRLLTTEQAAAIDYQMLAWFLKTPLCKRLQHAKRVEREYRFSLLCPAKEFLQGVHSQDQVLLQGVVDCFFEEEGELVIIDFKTDHIASDAVEERKEHYRPQLDAYAKALSRVLGRPVREKLLCFLVPREITTL